MERLVRDSSGEFESGAEADARDVVVSVVFDVAMCVWVCARVVYAKRLTRASPRWVCV